MILPDRQSGVLDQLVLRGWADEWIAAAKICGHIIGFGIPLLLATPVAIALLGVPDHKALTLVLGLALALPAFAGLGVTIAALTAGLNGEDARFVAIQLAQNGLALVRAHPAPPSDANGMHEHG